MSFSIHYVNYLNYFTYNLKLRNKYIQSQDKGVSVAHFSLNFSTYALFLIGLEYVFIFQVNIYFFRFRVYLRRFARCFNVMYLYTICFRTRDCLITKQKFFGFVRKKNSILNIFSEFICKNSVFCVKKFSILCVFKIYVCN